MIKDESMLMNGEDKESHYMLYKYRGWGDVLSNLRLMRIIKNCKLYFSCYADFNDPFDCRIYPYSISEDWVKATIKSLYPQCSDEEIEDKIKVVNLVELAKHSIKKYMGEVGICCMTKSPDNILMWSHYANGHKGVCFGFDLRKDPVFFDYLRVMQYKYVYPNIPDSITREYADILIGTKYAGWSYEQEVRIWKKSVGEHEFEPETLREIIFGCQANEVMKGIIMNVVRHNPALNHVQFFQAETSATDYKLDITPLDC